MKKQNKSRLGPFIKLNQAQKTLIELDFKGGYKNSEIARQIGVKNDTTVSHWRARDWYQPAMEDYMKMQVNTTYQVKAVQTCFKLLNAKSEMVRLQAASTIFRLSGMLSDNSTPELDKARIRKANADARVAEARAKAMEENGQDMEQLLDKMLDTLTKEDKKNGNS